MNIQWRGQAPKYTPGRSAAKIDRIVIHRIYGSLASADTTFLSGSRNNSAHYGVGWGGEVYQWVKDQDTAWHASSWPMNLRSIGIEHQDNRTETYTDAQYRTSGELVRKLCADHAIPIDRAHIIKHNEVAPTSCPGLLDIDRIIREAKQQQGIGGNNMDVSDEGIRNLIIWVYLKVIRGQEPSPAEREAALADIKAGGSLRVGDWVKEKVDSDEAKAFRLAQCPPSIPEPADPEAEKAKKVIQAIRDALA